MEGIFFGIRGNFRIFGICGNFPGYVNLLSEIFLEFCIAIQNISGICEFFWNLAGISLEFFWNLRNFAHVMICGIFPEFAYRNLLLYESPPMKEIGYASHRDEHIPTLDPEMHIFHFSFRHGIPNGKIRDMDSDNEVISSLNSASENGSRL